MKAIHGITVGLLLTALTGCQGAGGNMAGNLVAIGTTKPDLFGMPAEYRALHPALENQLGRPVRFNAQPNGRAIGSQLEQGNMAYALMSASEYAAVVDPSKLTLVAAAVNPLGQTSRKAHVIARATDNRFKTISDCKDKRFAFGTYGDALTDLVARRTLEANDVPMKKILPELLPPPLAMEGRLYANNAASAIALDITVNAGVIDEIMWNKLPETGGNPLTGPSKDQFKIIGATDPLPEMVVVAGPAADPAMTAKLKQFLIEKVKDDANICQQLGIKGFAEADRSAYDAAAKLLAAKK